RATPPRGRRAAVAPDFAEAGPAGATIPLHDPPQPCPIIGMRSGDAHRHAQPKCRNENMALAPFDFLGPIKADVLPLRCRLETLALGTARRGLGPSPWARAFPLAQ